MKIRFKLSIFIIMLITLAILLLAYVFFQFEKRNMKEILDEKQVEIMTSLLQMNKESIFIGDNLLLINYVNFLMRQHRDIVSVSIYDDMGKILANSDPKIIGQTLSDIKELYAFLPDQRGMQKSILSEPAGQMIVYKTALQLEKVKYFVHVKFSKRIYDETISNMIKEVQLRILQLSLLYLFFGIAASVIFTFMTLRPLKKLEAGIQTLSSGNLDIEIESNSKDELGLLSREFNNMTAKLKELDQMKDDFISSVTHELRSPLGAIESLVNLMLEDQEELVKNGKENLLIIKKNMKRFGAFINDILEVAKLEAGKTELKKQIFNVNDLILEAVKLFESQAREKKIRLHYVLKEGIAPVFADYDKINQVACNLINNALKFTPADGSIQVSTGLQEAGMVYVCVSDSGMGIDKKYHERIFNRFEQASSTNKLINAKGTGLGLAIAKMIIKLHKGNIWVESELNRGSRFYFTLPASIAQ